MSSSRSTSGAVSTGRRGSSPGASGSGVHPHDPRPATTAAGGVSGTSGRPLATDLRHQEATRERADLVEPLAHARQRGRAEDPRLEVVEGDHGDVLRDPHPLGGEALEEPEGLTVGRDHECGGTVGGDDDTSRHLPPATAARRRLDRLEEVRVVDHETVGEERLAVRTMAFDHVRLDESADEADPGVTVRDEVLDRGERAAVVVGQDQRGLEPVDPVGQHDRLARVLQALQHRRVHGEGDRDGTVDLVPGQREVEGGHPDDDLGDVGRVEGLHDDDPSTRRGDLAVEAGEEPAEVEAARAAGEGEHRERVVGRHERRQPLCCAPDHGADIP